MSWLAKFWDNHPLAVLTFIGYKRTDKETNKIIYIDREDKTLLLKLFMYRS